MRRLTTWAGFWIALFPLWLLYEGEWDRSEVVAGASAAAIGATAALVAVEAALPRQRIELSSLARAAKVPWALVREFAIITAFLVRNPRGSGQFQTYEYPVGRNDPTGRSRRGALALLVAFSPNSYILDIDPETNEVLAHTLQPSTREQVMLE